MNEQQEQRITERINAALRALAPRDPRYRYWETEDGWRFHYTTERMGDGKFASAIYMPKGRGARSGNARTLVVRRELHHSSRRSAKARAYRLYLHRKAELAERKNGPVR